LLVMQLLVAAAAGNTAGAAHGLGLHSAVNCMVSDPGFEANRSVVQNYFG
jgi:hypothetical protein